ncbi:MAG: hypothetical protein Q4G70_10225 [Pseudomonadota bacterium]|nr:hypothetical protein [Pseudomonadota bacterium]
MPGNRSGWVLALLAALALHGAALWLLQPSYYAVAPTARPSTWRVQVHAREVPAPAAKPIAQPVPAPAPESAPPPPPIERPTVPPPPAPEEALPASPEPTAPTPPESDLVTATDSAMPWLDANLADQAPTPVDNEWHLTEMPWPQAFPMVEVHVWITSDGRIEHYEIQGDAANDLAMRALFAPFAETPMRPAYFGGMPVPSIMRIQIWEGDGPAPDFVSPLPPASAASAVD